MTRQAGKYKLNFFMKQQEALRIAEENKSSIIDKEYKSIMQRIERAIKNGREDTALGFKLPCDEIISKLKQDGFWLYYIGGNLFCPKIFGVSWKAIEPKKKWYHKFLQHRTK